jgi:hypothetical protein
MYHIHPLKFKYDFIVFITKDQNSDKGSCLYKGESNENLKFLLIY